MTTEAPETDAELVEWIRQKMQAMIEEACNAFAAGESWEDYEAKAGLPSETMLVAASDLREIGSFKLQTPANAPRRQRSLRHWVYVHRETGRVYAIHWPNRMLLQTVGFARLLAFTHDPSQEN